MARTVITAQAFASLKTLPLAGGASQPTLTAADSSNFNSTVFTGPIMIVAYNTHATLARTVTITSVADPVFGRTGDITGDSIPALGIALYGPFYPNGWQQTADQSLYYQASTADVKFAVMKVPS